MLFGGAFKLAALSQQMTKAGADTSLKWEITGMYHKYPSRENKLA